MATTYDSNNNALPVAEQDSLASISFRDAFEGWLKKGNAKKYSPESLLSCMDRVSEYAVRKKSQQVDFGTI